MRHYSIENNIALRGNYPMTLEKVMEEEQDNVHTLYNDTYDARPVEFCISCRSISQYKSGQRLYNTLDKVTKMYSRQTIHGLRDTIYLRD